SPLYKKVQGKLDVITGNARENLSGVRVIRAFGREKEESEKFSQANHELVKEQLFVGRISALMNPLTYSVVNIGIIAILWAGSRSVEGGVLMSGDIVALVNYMSQILVELVKLANLIVTISRAMASLGRVEQVLDTKTVMEFPESTKRGETISINKTEEAVSFDHVSLSYAQAGEESLSDISFSVKRGETIGIIGGTGSGKSSLVHLIPRFYDATSGQIFLLGRPIQEWDREELRKKVGIVMQKVQVFSGTIRSNLLMGNEGASEEEMWQALRIAQAEEFVRKKSGGLDETVEQGGRNLSGGQRQRLTIARALVRRPEILILDDSSSALDYATDAALRKELKSLPSDVTVFLVSQRTSSIRHADHILVLEDGKAAGWGTHEELLESCEIYREIYESQYGKGGRAV
ncbi:MAG TPA: ABC transporter ATP-binding protein/permease, partial [Candidatus Blautia ornithocaccae]|nr:ABC transporter ATP-binding protein/permease [Candidatus Blautia ornithocaccae]